MAIRRFIPMGFTPMEYAPGGPGRLAPHQTADIALSLVYPWGEPAGLKVPLR